jgi:hypothetical protein
MSLSMNAALPGFLEVSQITKPDIRIWLNERPPWYPTTSEPPKEPFYTSPDLDASGRHSISVWKLPSVPGFHIVYNDGIEFFLDSSGSKIWATWPSCLSVEDVAIFLRGPIMGLILRLRGQIPLHASAVETGGRAIILMGPPGAGKSTTAAAFAQMGCPVLSDDIVPLIDEGETFLAQPGYPYVCLWPKSVEALFGAADALPLLTPNWTKRFLSLQENKGFFRNKPLPVATIYWLDARPGELESSAIESLTPQAALIALVGNTYMNYLLDTAMRVKEFELLQRVVAHIPIRRVRPRRELKGIQKLCHLIQEDLALVPEASLTGSQERSSPPRLSK